VFTNTTSSRRSRDSARHPLELIPSGANTSRLTYSRNPTRDTRASPRSRAQKRSQLRLTPPKRHRPQASSHANPEVIVNNCRTVIGAVSLIPRSFAISGTYRTAGASNDPVALAIAPRDPSGPRGAPAQAHNVPTAITPTAPSPRRPIIPASIQPMVAAQAATAPQLPSLNCRPVCPHHGRRACPLSAGRARSHCDPWWRS